MAVVRDQLFPQKPSGSRFRLSRTGVQPSPGSSTIELPSAFAESLNTVIAARLIGPSSHPSYAPQEISLQRFSTPNGDCIPDETSSEGWRHAKGREHCRGEPGSALISGGYTPDSAKAEGNSIVDEPGEG